MALGNNPTQLEVVKAIKDLENNMPTQITSIDGLAGGQLTSALYLAGGDAASGAANIQLDTNGQITAKGTTSTLFGRNSSTTLLVGHSSHALTLRGSATRPTYNGNALALSSDIPSAVTESTVSGWGFTKNAGTITKVQLNGTDVASSGTANVQALPNYSLSIGSTNGGSPRQVLFMTVNYTNFDSNNGAYFKLGAMESHGNGASYAFLEDIIIGVSYTGTVSCNVYKYVQSAVTLDSVARNYGDVFYTIDTTNKIVYFYILMGQYTSAQFTPATKIGATKAITSANGIVQKSGTPTYYSSGTKVWASGNSTTYARLSDIPTSYVSSVNGQTGAVTVPSMPFTLTLVGTYTTKTLVSDIIKDTNIYLLVPYLPGEYVTCTVLWYGTSSSQATSTAQLTVPVFIKKVTATQAYFTILVPGTSAQATQYYYVRYCKIYKVTY